MISIRSWADLVIRKPVNNDPVDAGVTMDNNAWQYYGTDVPSRDFIIELNSDLGYQASQPLVREREDDMDDLSKLVASCERTYRPGISNSSVRGHDGRPAKRLRTENQESTVTSIASLTRSTRTRARRITSEELTDASSTNMEVSHENHTMGLVSRKKDVVGSGDSRSELTSRLGLEVSKKGGVSLIDSLTADEIQEHIDSLGKTSSLIVTKRGRIRKVSNEADDPDGGCALCDMNSLVFNPLPIYCIECNMRIKRNLIYYWTSDEMGKKHCFCGDCYRKSKRGNSIAAYGPSFCKSSFKKEKNNAEGDEENWVQCDKCESWQHQICGLYNPEDDSEGKAKYICPPCRLQEIRVGEHIPMCSPFRAKDLPCTKLSDHIEKRLQRRLKEEKLQRAISLGKRVHEVPGAENLVVRVVVSANKLVEVKQQFVDIFGDKNYPSEIPYKSKMILLFQKIKGVDVCLFAMYVQEYGSECHPPNQRSVYISYIDSVNYFQPQIRTVHGEALRTFVYHEILNGYLDYCKKLGFETCYIWACPPLKNEDYILNCHPESQKNPKEDKLRQWYKSMLLKASEENIVTGTTNFYDRFFVPNVQGNTKVTTANLPYFDGAYWVGAAEDLYMRFDKEQRLSEEMTKNKLSRRALKSMGHKNLSGESEADIYVMKMLGELVFRLKEDFFIVHLQFCCSSCHKSILSPNHWLCAKCKSFRVCPSCINRVPSFSQKTHFIDGKNHKLSKVVVSDVPETTDDEDVVLDHDVFDNRNSFLHHCQKSHYQFDSLRRAKYSSMRILHHLHKNEPTQSSCVTECGTNNKQLTKDLKVKEILKTLVHAVQCKSSKQNPCSNSKCGKLKSIFNHASQCKISVPGGCQLCKMVWGLLNVHSRNCKVSDCRVPRCKDIKMSRNLETTHVDDVQRAAMEVD